VTLDDVGVPFHVVYSVTGQVTVNPGAATVASAFTYSGGGTTGSGNISGSAAGLDLAGGVITGHQLSPASTCSFSGTIDIAR
jgi:hypothetical protein